MKDIFLNKTYDPLDVEEKWYEFWLEGGYFRADENSSKPPYSIVIPPPNVTGSLHMGHALNNTLQDIMARYKRMQGYNVLWLPGTDHAGIATQNVVEKHLALKNISRKKLGRELFIEKVWEWKEEFGGVIVNQLKKLGASSDWSRERFTMDDGLSQAVKEVFVKLYNDNLIYKGDYIINWCPRCQTALSDLEVEHEEEDGQLYQIKYPVKGESGSIIIATTRPETLLGDTAVAVNPEDERYKKYLDKKVVLPLVGREIPVISDSHVDMNFGTGALKITPGHDFNDFEIGKRHDLEVISVMDKEGNINEHGYSYSGLTSQNCRSSVVKDLEEQGLLVKIENHPHSVGHCYRCRTIVEPMISEQWFVKVESLAKPAIDAVKEGKTRIIPKQWENTYFEWMENIKDWCISRQIWWGHRIPAWYCKSGHITVTVESPKECSSCGSNELNQETDVLDTWFSSALWPFSTMGWPDDSKELDLFYSTSLLVTGFDILFFWVARMMMMGLKFMGKVPFKDVYIHALVRDAEGQKMSKSKGNVIDPLTTIEKYGTDAFRFTLAAFASQGRDIKLAEDRIEGYRNFVNKIWNASRFALMNLDDYSGEEGTLSLNEMALPERWILTRLNRTVLNVTSFLDTYRFNDAANCLYQFVWHEFCDWYIEMAKSALYGKEGAKKREVSQAVLFTVLKTNCKLLHPFMPFITEELFSYLPKEGNNVESDSIMVKQFPESIPEFIDNRAEDDMNLVMGVIKAIRNIKGEMGLPPSSTTELKIKEGSKQTLEIISKNFQLIKTMAKVSEITYIDGGPPEGAAMAVVSEMELYVPLEGNINIDDEKKRLNKEFIKVEKDLDVINKKLSNKKFISNAPKEVVDKNKNRLEDLKNIKSKIEESLERLKCLK